MKRRTIALALTLASTFASSGVHAQTADASSAVRAEAGERFDRGLRLFNGGDSAVEATDALDRVLANPGSLSAERRAVAQRTRNEQASRVVEIAIESSVDGAIG